MGDEGAVAQISQQLGLYGLKGFQFSCGFSSLTACHCTFFLNLEKILLLNNEAPIIVPFLRALFPVGCSPAVGTGQGSAQLLDIPDFECE